MRLTQKLLGLLNRVFDIDPERYLALRINYDGSSLSWDISDGVLTTVVSDGIGSSLLINLGDYTIRDLIDFIAAQPGYTVTSSATSEQRSMSARTLIDGSGNVAQSNGDHLYAYTSQAWVYLDAAASELKLAADQIPNAIAQMEISTAEDDWLDDLGRLYGVRRQQGELDASYGPRIIAEVVRPKANNVAMEAAISYYTGQSTKVTDVVEYGDVFPLYNGAITRNSAYNYEALASEKYGLFDVQYGYNLLSSSDPSEFAMRVRSIIARIRAAGTHLRALALQSGALTDTFTPPTDGAMPLVAGPVLADAMTPPTESMASALALATFTDALVAPADTPSLTITYDYRYNSVRQYNGEIMRQGGMVVTE